MVEEAASFSRVSVSKERERFDALMRREGSRIYTLAVRLTGSVADGRDLAERAFVGAFRSFGSLRGDSAFGTRAYRICLDFWKKRQRTKKRSYFLSRFRSEPDNTSPAVIHP